MRAGAVSVDMAKFHVHIVPVLSDNYAYILRENKSTKCLVVDPAEARTVLDEVKRLGLTCEGVLTTHHHNDHAGGNADIVAALNVPVHGGEERVQAISNIVRHGDSIALGDITISVLSTPCHTRGHVCYLVKDDSSPAVFTGDTLFLGGCGRFFEGDAAQMQQALNEVLAGLPDETRVFCGHEYTVANLEFGNFAEPDNHVLKQRLVLAKEQRARNAPTVPGTIGEEKQTNVFMRTSVLPGSDPVSVMASLRECKNNWKG